MASWGWSALNPWKAGSRDDERAPAAGAGSPLPPEAPQRTHHHSSKKTQQAPDPVLERQRLVTKKAEDRIADMVSCKDIEQANIFLMTVEGFAVDNVARRVASHFDVSAIGIMDDMERDTPTEQAERANKPMTLSEINDRVAGDIWTDGNAARIFLMARMEKHLNTATNVLSLSGQKVRVIAGSPAEDLLVWLPALIGHGDVDRVTIEMFRNGFQRRWKIFNRALLHGCSVYVYLRMSDNSFAQHCHCLQTFAGGAEKVQAMIAYRFEMDTLFKKSDFINQQHTLQIEIDSTDFSSDQLALEIAQLVSEFILLQNSRRVWRQKIDMKVWKGLVTNTDYAHSRTVTAVHESIINGPDKRQKPYLVAKTLDAPVAASVVAAANRSALLPSPPALSPTRSNDSVGSMYSRGGASSGSRLTGRSPLSSGSGASASVTPPLSIASSVSAASGSGLLQSGASMSPTSARRGFGGSNTSVASLILASAPPPPSTGSDSDSNRLDSPSRNHNSQNLGLTAPGSNIYESGAFVNTKKHG